MPKPCKHCASLAHASTFCFKAPRKALAATNPQNHKQHTPCKHCGSQQHLSFQCSKLKLPLEVRDLLKPRKPIQKIGRQTRMWKSTREQWLKGNETYVCHYCGKWLTRETVTVDHKIPRSRAPELRNDPDNLVPSCYVCNGLKGSVAHDEYVHTCH